MEELIEVNSSGRLELRRRIGFILLVPPVLALAGALLYIDLLPARLSCAPSATGRMDCRLSTLVSSEEISDLVSADIEQGTDERAGGGESCGVMLVGRSGYILRPKAYYSSFTLGGRSSHIHYACVTKNALAGRIRDSLARGERFSISFMHPGFPLAAGIVGIFLIASVGLLLKDMFSPTLRASVDTERGEIVFFVGKYAEERRLDQLAGISMAGQEAADDFFSYEERVGEPSTEKWKQSFRNANITYLKFDFTGAPPAYLAFRASEEEVGNIGMQLSSFTGAPLNGMGRDQRAA